jgi:hypothetical protein
MPYATGQATQLGIPQHSQPDHLPVNGRFEHHYLQPLPDWLPSTQVNRSTPIRSNWSAPATTNQITALHGQIKFLQKALGEEVQSHNQTRTACQHYCENALGWERHHSYALVKIQEMDAVIVSLRQKIPEPESKQPCCRMTEPNVTNQVVSSANMRKEENQLEIKQIGRKMVEPIIEGLIQPVCAISIQIICDFANSPQLTKGERSDLQTTARKPPAPTLSLQPNKRKNFLENKEGIDVKRSRTMAIEHVVTEKRL